MSLFSINSPPVGYRFRPTNIELVDHYLKLKNKGHHDQVTIISEVDICKYDPWELPGLSMIQTKDNEWYFFCQPNYQRGCRVKRATKTGYWKSTGNDRVIKCGKKEIGRKKSLVFHTGRGSDAKGTHWKIHEYRATEKALDGTDSGQGGFVLCRLFLDEDKKKDDDNESLDCNEDEHNFSPAVEIQSEPVTPTASRRLEKQPARSESCPAEISERIVLHTPLIANYTKDQALSIEPDQDLERTLRDFRDPTPPMVSQIFSRLQYSENQGEVPSGPHLTLDFTNYGPSSSFVSQQDNSLGRGSFNAVSADNNSVTEIIRSTRQPLDQLNDHCFTMHGNVRRRRQMNFQVDSIYRSTPEDLSNSLENCEEKETEAEVHLVSRRLVGKIVKDHDENIESLTYGDVKQIFSTAEETSLEPITPIIRSQAELHPTSMESCIVDNTENQAVDNTSIQGPITPIMSTQAEMHPSSMENSIADDTESRALDDAYIQPDQDLEDALRAFDEPTPEQIDSKFFSPLQFECCTNALDINECFEPNIVDSSDQAYQDSGNHNISTVESETPNHINTSESLSVKQDGLCNESDVEMTQGKVALAEISSPDINTGTGIILRARQPRDQENDQSFSAHGNAPRRLRLQMKLQVSSTYCSLPKDLSYNEDSYEVKQKPIEGEHATSGEVARELSFPTRMVAKAPPALRLLVIIIFFTVFIGAWGYFKIFVS